MAAGLYDDGSAMWQVAGQPYPAMGGPAALMLQLAHPKVAQGVADHSEFKDNPLARLFSTLDYLAMVVFGTKQEAHRVAWQAMRAHDRVNGPGYSAHDHDLLVWVYATLFEGARDIYERLHGEMAPDLAERYYQESVHLATLLGAPREAMPADLATFRGYWTEMVNSLEVSDVAHGEVRAILYPKSWLFRPSAPLYRFLTAGLLPPHIRDQYGLPWSSARARLFQLIILTLSVPARLTPRAARRLAIKMGVPVLRRTRWRKYQAPVSARRRAELHEPAESPD